jgi:hypothetical protein
MLNAVTFIIADFERACNSATGLVLTFIPVSIFFSLQMNLGLKLGLGALLCLSCKFDVPPTQCLTMPILSFASGVG